MKYIRTPIGIYDLENSVFYDFDGLCKYHISHCEYYENNPEDCKTSDTIEELCDEFVMTHYFKETNYTKCEVLKEDKDLMIKAVRLRKQHNKDKDLKNEFNIYGCIWIDKGLIYVAKMNGSGDLELI